MCVLILHAQQIPGYPLVVGANRDESRERPSDPPLIWPQGFLAPRDRRAGGTWIGFNHSGVLVGITNRSAEPVAPDRPSRGALVTEGLTAPTARAAVQRIERTAFSSPQNPCNLLVADRREAFLLISSDALRVHPLAPGTHVLSNRHELGDLDLGDLTPPPEIDPALARLKEICQDHGKHGYAVCKHGDRYGTVSSILIAIGDGHAHRLEFAEGLPCETPYTDLGDLARTLPSRR